MSSELKVLKALETEACERVEAANEIIRENSPKRRDLKRKLKELDEQEEEYLKKLKGGHMQFLDRLINILAWCRDNPGKWAAILDCDIGGDEEVASRILKACLDNESVDETPWHDVSESDANRGIVRLLHSLRDKLEVKSDTLFVVFTSEPMPKDFKHSDVEFEEGDVDVREPTKELKAELKFCPEAMTGKWDYDDFIERIGELAEDEDGYDDDDLLIEGDNTVCVQLSRHVPIWLLSLKP